MSLDSLLYLLETYWPFLLGALLIGAGAGWWSAAPNKTPEAK